MSSLPFEFVRREEGLTDVTTSDVGIQEMTSWVWLDSVHSRLLALMYGSFLVGKMKIWCTGLLLHL